MDNYGAKVKRVHFGVEKKKSKFKKENNFFGLYSSATRKTNLDKFWIELCMALIGERLTESNEIW